MKYKVGDKVKIKTWEEMEKEFGCEEDGYIDTNSCRFLRAMEKVINKKFPDRILTIKEKYENNYQVKGLGFAWTDNMIQCLLGEEEERKWTPILNRYEILDLRGYK